MAVAASPESVPLARLPQTQTLSAVRAWLYVLAALVVLMVAVGGATRLTGSGLSITEWKPVTGAIPPLTEQAWMAEFEKYRQISQYELVNKGMTLSEFKVIYGWEWGHRQLGRLLGLVFFLPLVWFWARGIVRGRLALTLLAIGALGGLQATVGWIMVASGLEPGMTAVAPIKLTLHLTIASIILACLVWVAAGLKERSDAWREKSFGSHAPRVLAALILLQIALGGLVAGLQGGAHLQHLAAHGRGFRPTGFGAFRGAALDRELRRQRGAGAVQPPDGGLCHRGLRPMACMEPEPESCCLASRSSGYGARRPDDSPDGARYRDPAARRCRSGPAWRIRSLPWRSWGWPSPTPA
jgi:heme A synthase